MTTAHESIFSKRLDWYLEEHDQQSLPTGEERIFIGHPPVEGGGMLYSEESIFLGIPPLSQLLPGKAETKFFDSGRFGNIHGRMPIHALTVDDLRRFPLYLTDAVLKPNRILMPGDHYLYWAWSGAFFRYLTGVPSARSWHMQTGGPPPGMSGTPIQSSESRPSRYGPHLWGEEYKSVLEDFFTLLHLVLLPIRERIRLMDAKPQIYSLNPSFLGVQKDLGLKFATGSGFSILEGLLRRRCEELNENGIVKQGFGPISLPHKTLHDGSRAYLYDALILWRENNADSIVKQTLEDIDDVGRYQIPSLISKFRGLSYNDLIHHNLSGPSLLKGIKEQRNYNIHGEDSTMAIGAVVITLSCLVLWDELNESNIQHDLSNVPNPNQWPSPATYSSEKEETLDLIQQHQNMLDNRYWSVPTDATGLPLDRLTPRIFYPIDISFEPLGLEMTW